MPGPRCDETQIPNARPRAIRHTVAASLALPALLLTGLALPLVVLPAGSEKAHTLITLEPALLSYAAVLLAALVLPGATAQALRRRDPIRAGALSTNWNWLCGLALIPLAGMATFALTPPTGLTTPLDAHLALTMTVTAAALSALRLLTAFFLRLRPHGTGLGRDMFITQNTPNVFLWLAMTAVLAPTTGHHPSVIGLGVALVFFLAVYADERIFLDAHRRDLSPTPPERRRPPTHPPEPTYPCCLPALGEFSQIAPREGLLPAYPIPTALSPAPPTGTSLP